MGWKLKQIDLCGCNQLKPNEERDLCIFLEEEKRAAIHGTVKFPNGKPVKGAVVKLFKKKDLPDFKDLKDAKDVKDFFDKCDLIPVTFTFTDDCGQFLFGVESYVDYVIKVFYYKPEKPYKAADYPEGEEKPDYYD